MPILCIAPIKGKGRCLFARENIAKGESIDTNPVILFPHWQTLGLKDPLQSYPFAWDKDFDCIPLGSVTIANHSDDPNAFTQRDFGNLLLRLVALRDIEVGEEITYDYKVPLWFEPKPPSRLTIKEIENGTSY
jgi:SET domain-containing protein